MEKRNMAELFKYNNDRMLQREIEYKQVIIVEVNLLEIY